MKIGTKLYASFLAVVLIFGAICIYMVVSINGLHHLEEESEGRSADALHIKDIKTEVIEIYSVIADGIINRNLAEFKENFAQVRTRALDYINQVKSLVDTAEEEALAEEFERNLKVYLNTVISELTPILEKEESVARRAEDSLAVKDIEIRLGKVYAVMADAIINRDMEQAEADLDRLKLEVEADIATVHAMADTAEERKNAEAYSTLYRQYIELFEADLMPLLASDAMEVDDRIKVIDAALDQTRNSALDALGKMSASLREETQSVLADEAQIKVLDEAIDGFRDATLVPLVQIVDALSEEQAEAAAAFDALVVQVSMLAVLVSIIGLITAVLLAFFITRNITRPLKQVTRISTRISMGDFEIEKLTIKNKDEIGAMAEAFGTMVDSLKYKAEVVSIIASGDLTVDIKKASNVDGLGQSLLEMRESLNTLLIRVATAIEQVSSGAAQVSQAGQELSQGATEQASSLEEISSSLNEISSQATENADNSTTANSLADTAVQNAEAGNSKMDQLMAAMGRINESSDQISKVVKVIDDIAFQINLLALNANVEAARAGKYGKGFAVVAEEVRNLAIRSAEAVQETTQMVEETTRNITNGTESAEETATQLSEIVTGSGKVAQLLAGIATASKEQASAVQQINEGLEQIDQVTQSNTASAEESASAGEELASQAQQLKQMIAQFKLSVEHASTPSQRPAEEAPEKVSQADLTLHSGRRKEVELVSV